MTDFRMTPEAERVVTVHGCPQGCVDQVTELKAEVIRLTDCLEETIDELLCGNRLYAQLLDRQNDAASLLDSANQTINRLREELTQKANEIKNLNRQIRACHNNLACVTRNLESLSDHDNGLEDRLQASEQARQDAVRELEAERIRHQQDVDIDSDCRRDLQSRLSRAEEALRGLHRWLTDPGVKVLCEGLPEQMGYSGACQKVVAALQPETDDPAAKYYPPDALQPEGEKK